MNEYIKKVDTYSESVKEEFNYINEYNNKLCTYGFAIFFALSSLVKDIGNKQIFYWSILSMSISTFIFVIHEIFKSLYFSRYSSNKSSAIENLPNDNLLNHVTKIDTIIQIRFQKWNKYFFYPALLFGLIAVITMFLNYYGIIKNQS